MSLRLASAFRRTWASCRLFVLATLFCACSDGGQASRRKSTPADAQESPPPAPLTTLKAELVLGNRDYITSVLLEIFTPTGAEHDLDPILREEIRSSLGAFGGACNMYSTAGLSDCSLQQKGQMGTGDTTVSFRQSSSASREARRLRACERIVDQVQAVGAAIAKIDGAKPDRVPTADQTAGAFDLFYPGQVLDVPTKAALDDLVADAHGDAGAAWQTLLLALCVSPGWQVP